MNAHWFFKFKMHLIVINDNASIDARKTCSLTTIMMPNCLHLHGYQHEASCSKHPVWILVRTMTTRDSTLLWFSSLPWEISKAVLN